MKAPASHLGVGRRRFTQGAAAGAVTAAFTACGSSTTDPSLDGDGTQGGSDGSSDGGVDSDGSDGGPTGDGDSSTGSSSETGPDPTGEQGAPVWMTVPTLSFVQGVPSEVSVAAYVSDPEGDALTLMLNDVALPEGVTFDPTSMTFVYDGSGPAATTSGHVLAADDGAA
ncbi:MAG: hypothetical protein AAF721_23170 [Myxococcota bacterium]